MADFKQGVFDAPAVELAPCGLLSVARTKVWDADDEKWLRGYNYEVISTPSVTIENNNNAVVTDGVVSAGDSVGFYPGEGFVITVEKTSSGMGLVGTDLLEDARAELISASQKALEYELWEGVAIRAGSGEGVYLRKQSGADIVTSGGASAAIALRSLEQAIANSPIGSRGIIHVTRDVASELGNKLLYKGKGDSATEDRAITRLGTRVVIGSGYTGNGPVGDAGAAASATNKWMYATSAVDVNLGSYDVVSTPSTAFRTDTNDALVVIQRAAAVHFDPSIWYAAQVTLPTS